MCRDRRRNIRIECYQCHTPGLARTASFVVHYDRCHKDLVSAKALIQVKKNIARGKNIPVVAVLPQAKEQSRTYLQSHNVPVSEIVTESLDKTGVSGTPTLMVIGLGPLRLTIAGVGHGPLPWPKPNV